jgi:DNA-binding response OmpR family regulator
MRTTEKTILVIYNFLNDIKTILELLQESGYRTQTLSYRQAQSTKTLTEPPDLILVDRRGHSPADLSEISSLCDVALMQAIPIVAMTTLEDLIDLYPFYWDYQIDYLLNSFEAEELLSRLETHLKGNAWQENGHRNPNFDHLMTLPDNPRLQLNWIDHLNHQIRTPLHGILGHIQMLYRESDLSLEQQAHLRSIEDCSHDVLRSMHQMFHPTDGDECREDEALETQPSTPVALDKVEIPPSHELIALHEAAKIGDIEGIVQESLRLKDLNLDYSRFADRILELAQAFEDRQILALIRQYTPLEQRVN